MELKLFFGVVVTAFLAELGDKSQVLTLLYASGKQMPPWLVFVGVSVALVTATGIGVLAGTTIAQFVSEKVLAWVAGVGFVCVGIMTLYRAASL